jgi:hypothetical protein
MPVRKWPTPYERIGRNGAGNNEPLQSGRRDRRPLLWAKTGARSASGPYLCEMDTKRQNTTRTLKFRLCSAMIRGEPILRTV